MMNNPNSTKSKAGEAKFSLLEWFSETEIPKLEEAAARIESESNKRVVVRHQCDGAGPHTDKTFTEELNRMFSERGWIFKFQPANSPLTNVKDACVFPCLSKAVTAEQGLSFGSCVLKTEQLLGAIGSGELKIESHKFESCHQSAPPSVE